MKWLKDKDNKVFQITHEQDFWNYHPDLFLRPLSDDESKEFAKTGKL